MKSFAQLRLDYANGSHEVVMPGEDGHFDAEQFNEHGALMQAGWLRQGNLIEMLRAERNQPEGILLTKITLDFEDSSKMVAEISAEGIAHRTYLDPKGRPIQAEEAVNLEAIFNEIQRSTSPQVSISVT